MELEIVSLVTLDIFLEKLQSFFAQQLSELTADQLGDVMLILRLLTAEPVIRGRLSSTQHQQVLDIFEQVKQLSNPVAMQAYNADAVLRNTLPALLERFATHLSLTPTIELTTPTMQVALLNLQPGSPDVVDSDVVFRPIANPAHYFVVPIAALQANPNAQLAVIYHSDRNAALGVPSPDDVFRAVGDRRSRVYGRFPILNAVVLNADAEVIAQETMRYGMALPDSLEAHLEVVGYVCGRWSVQADVGGTWGSEGCTTVQAGRNYECVCENVALTAHAMLPVLASKAEQPVTADASGPEPSSHRDHRALHVASIVLLAIACAVYAIVVCFLLATRKHMIATDKRLSKIQAIMAAFGAFACLLTLLLQPGAFNLAFCFAGSLLLHFVLYAQLIWPVLMTLLAYQALRATTTSSKLERALLAWGLPTLMTAAHAVLSLVQGEPMVGLATGFCGLTNDQVFLAVAWVAFLLFGYGIASTLLLKMQAR
jgi:hypothetical protein